MLTTACENAEELNMDGSDMEARPRFLSQVCICTIIKGLAVQRRNVRWPVYVCSEVFNGRLHGVGMKQFCLACIC